MKQTWIEFYNDEKIMERLTPMGKPVPVYSQYTHHRRFGVARYTMFRLPWKRIPSGRDTGNRVEHTTTSHRGPFVRTSAKQVSHRFALYHES